MRIYFGLVPFTTPASVKDLPYTGQVINNTIVPDHWAAIKALPNFSIQGDGITPVDGQSVLSFQPGMGLQARPAGAAGKWEVVAFGGGYFAIDPDDNTLQGPYPYIAVSA